MRYRSMKYGWSAPEFSVSEVELAISGSCTKTGIPFSLSHRGKGKQHPFSASPDRINSDIGYTKANVQWVCWMFNRMKGDSTEEDISLFVEGLVRTHT